MEASLVKFGTTLALGFFFILIVWKIGKLFRLWNDESMEDKGMFKGLLIPSILVISLFVGIVIEDWSDQGKLI